MMSLCICRVLFHFSSVAPNVWPDMENIKINWCSFYLKHWRQTWGTSYICSVLSTFCYIGVQRGTSHALVVFCITFISYIGAQCDARYIYSFPHNIIYYIGGLLKTPREQFYSGICSVSLSTILLYVIHRLAQLL